MGLCKDIRKGWEEFNAKTSIRIRNGSHTRFWWDIWAGNFKLKDVYPTIFRITSHKNAIVAESWKREGDEGGCWEVHFRRPFQDWEEEEVTCFLGFLDLLKVQEGEDTLCWKEDRRGFFSVKSYYCSLSEENSFVFLGEGGLGIPCSSQNLLFCLGSCLGEDPNCRHFNEEGMTNG